ncbi:OsmC family protein [Brachybacterium huguangmaarense]
MPDVPDDTFAPSPAFGEGTVWADRTGRRELVGRNQRGVEIPIGHGEGRISPGELLKLALIGCAGMSADFTISRRLGDDFPMRLLAHGTSAEESNRYEEIDEEIQLDLSGLDEAGQERLRRLILQAIGVGCTVERTLVADPEIRHGIVDVPARGRVAMPEPSDATEGERA